MLISRDETGLCFPLISWNRYAPLLPDESTPLLFLFHTISIFGHCQFTETEIAATKKCDSQWH